jgi:hypothetical protein
LVDRGANKGIAGNNSRIIARTEKYIDLCGVDDHKVSNLELVTAGVVVMTQKGPLIIIMNQWARMVDGKMIHLSGQMEHHKIIVKEWAFAVTNVIPCIELLEGYRTPLCFINGLPYMRLCAHNDEEWNTLPHVPITSNAPWDPRILDHIPLDKWFSEQPQCLELIEESTYNEHGTHKESLSPSHLERGS